MGTKEDGATSEEMKAELSGAGSLPTSAEEQLSGNSLLQKLKQSRSHSAGWITRSINQWNGQQFDSVPVVEILRDRITSQMKRLQQYHDKYVSAIDDDNEFDDAEKWMEEELGKITQVLADMDQCINRLKSSVNLNSPSTSGPVAPVLPPESSEQQIAPGSSGSSQAQQPESQMSRSLPQSNDATTSQTGDPLTGRPDRRPLDAWIDDLEVGVETFNPANVSTNEDLPQIIARLELDRDLPKVALPVFDGSPLLWPRFIEQFYTQVHSRPGLNDTRRMDRLQSHVSADAKRLIQGLGYSGQNYAQSLKELKFAFGHRAAVAKAYINAVMSGSVIPSGDAVALRNFYISVRDCITTLNQMNYTGELNSSEVLQRTARRIPNDKRGKWNEFVRGVYQQREPCLLDLQKWLKDRVEADFNPYAVAVVPNKQPSVSRPTSFPHVQHTTLNTSAEDNTEQNSFSLCRLCSLSHQLSRCPTYLSMSGSERYAYVRENRLCFNCLSATHRIADCRSAVLCREPGCGRKHHTSLHRDRPPSISTAENEHQVNNIQSKKPKVYFQVLPVVVQGLNGRNVKTYALLDSGSDITMINTDLAKTLGLKGQPRSLTVQTLTSATTVPSSKVTFTIKACDEPDGQSMLIREAWTTNRNFNCSSLQTSEVCHLEHVKDLHLVNVENDEVKILIGANVPKAHLQLEVREGQFEGPVAIHTHLGWCLMGSNSYDGVNNASARVNLIIAEEERLEQQIQQFWSTEAFGVTADLKTPMSVDDQSAMIVLKERTEFVNGHYVVPMLWKEKSSEMPNNREMAEKRFTALARRLSFDSTIKEKYSSVLNGYIAKGHARKMTTEEVLQRSSNTWYLPHFCVLNPRKPDKVRVVFDAAAKFNNTSLNTELITGPDLINSLFGVLLRFRTKSVALVADIADMFHQVRVTPTDADALRFFWKEDLDKPGPPDVYQMLVHIFGASDSPCCANFALRQVAVEESHSKTMAASTILSNFYVDDMLKSTDDASEAVSLVNDLTEILSGRGFKLTKWMSSSKEVLASIPKDRLTSPEMNLDLDDLPVERTLGVGWNVEQDAFIFQQTFNHEITTKRKIVGAVSSIFDPCGFLTPFTFRAKCLIQELWRCRIDWDETIPDHLYSQWQEWLAELKCLHNLSIPRYLGLRNDCKSELHLFCDASEMGFASVAYLRIVKEDIHCVLLAGKSHVAPIKVSLTIPKLELQGAVMSTRLATSLTAELQLDIENTVFWTDSLTVLRYISNRSKRFKVFVANRVSEILENSSVDQWRYVPSHQNPADKATRKLPAAQLTLEEMWFHGPSFLWQNRDNWPCNIAVGEPDENDENLKKNVNYAQAQPFTCDTLRQWNLADVIEIKKFSSWFALCKRTAWVLRAVRNFLASCFHQIPPMTDHKLTCDEMNVAEVCLVRCAQQQGFPEDFKRLSQGNELHENSKLRPLQPFFDGSCDAVRVGGRMRKDEQEIESKHQLLLPYEHHVTQLIVADAHLKLLHGGPEHMIATVRQRYWPVKCRMIAKKVMHSCMYCLRRTVKPAVPLMADLPRQRITSHTRPFYFSAVDYFGPMTVKRARSHVKRWGCLFTCLTTRAIHLELAESLETDDFIMVLSCFISRRGRPSEMYSDNGTNFRGIEKELRDGLSTMDQDKIHCYLLKNGVKWNFIPPHAPHFGGAWERLVRTVKTALRATLKEQCVSEMVLRTALLEVEAAVNSRPLTYNSSEPSDFTALSPNHFLYGGHSTVSPLGEFHKSEINSRKRWRQAQVVSDHLWQRWLKEYLPSLTVRTKWTIEKRNHQVNDLVLIVDPKVPRGQWILGRIIEVLPSDDGRVRAVRVKTSSGIFTRPVAKICVLEECMDC